MNKLHSIFARLLPFVPSWKDVARVLIFIAMFWLGGYWFGVGFHLSQKPIDIHLEVVG